MTVAIIEKFPIVRKGINLILDNCFPHTTVIEADTVSAFHRRHPGRLPDLVILGIEREPAAQCERIIRTIKHLYPDTEIVVYNGNIDLVMAKNPIHAGALGYLYKRNEVADLMGCTTDVLQHKLHVTIRAVESTLRQKKSLVPEITLTKREMQIAELLSEGISISFIAETISRKPTTVNSIKRDIFRKMQVDNILKLR